MKARFFISGLIAVGTLLGVLGTAGAYEPVREQGVEQRVGKTVYLAVRKEIRANLGSATITSRWLNPGTALTITGTRPEGSHGKRLKTSIITKTTDGLEVFVSVDDLSSEPLKYSYDDPGTLESFLSNVFEEAYGLPAKMDAIAARYDYGEITDSADSVLYKSMLYVFQEQASLVDTFRRGSRLATESLLKDSKYKWIVEAKDRSIMEAYSKGIKGTPFAAKAEQMADILNLLGRSIGFTIDIGSAKRTLQEKPWLRGIQNAPPDKRASLDAEKSADYTARIDKKKQEIKEVFQQAAALLAKLQQADRTPPKAAPTPPASLKAPPKRRP